MEAPQTNNRIGPWLCTLTHTHTDAHRHPHLYTSECCRNTLSQVWSLSAVASRIKRVKRDAGRGENQLQTVINTIGCARRGSLTSLACWMSVNWMWRVLWMAPSAASLFTKTPRVLMGTESPSLNKSLWQSPDSTIITPQENNKFSHLPENNNNKKRGKTQFVMCSGNLQKSRRRFKCLSQQMSQVSLFMGINFSRLLS